MKSKNPKLIRILSLSLAGALQIMPMIRSALPTLWQGIAPSSWSIIFRWAAGGVAYFGYHAVSSASSIAISPPNATLGVPYVGTVTYSGGHAGSVSSMSLTNICLGSPTALFAGLSIVYAGGNTATVSGTPTSTNTYPFSLKIFDSSGCGGGGNSDTRKTSIVIGPSGGGGSPPVITAPPQSLCAQVGADVLLSAGASGSPTPQYYWFLGQPSAGNLVSTSNSIHFASVQFSNAASYSVVASNASTPNILLAPFANCVLSVCQTAGTNQLAFRYTNFFPAGIALNLSASLTNVPGATNNYTWLYNGAPTVPPLPHTPTVTVSASAIKPAGSGTYSISFVSAYTNGAGVLVDGTSSGLYPSYWAFGLPPSILVSPSDTNASLGGSASFSATATNSSTAYGANTPFTCYWFLNTSNLVSSQTFTGLVATADLTLTTLNAGNAGSYTLVASNFWGAVTSSPAILGLGSSLSVTTPEGRTNYSGQNLSLNVAASGTAPFSYLWRNGVTVLSNGGPVSGATTNTLNIFPASTNDTGSYTVVVSNNSGSITSGVANVLIIPPPVFSLAAGTGGSVTLTASGGVGYSTNILEAASNLTGASWLSVQTNVTPANGNILLTDPNTSGFSQRFYRVRFP